MYRPKVRSNCFLSATTRPTCKITSNISTDDFYAGESGSDDDMSNSVANRTSTAGVEIIVIGAVSTLFDRILDLDKVGLDETIIE